MHRYFKPKRNAIEDSTPMTAKRHKSDDLGEEHCRQSSVDLKNLPADPGLRLKISSYHPNDQDEVRRAYIQKGPCQPLGPDFPQREMSGRNCLNPCDLFSSFDKEKLLRLAGFYPHDFSPVELMALDNQLQNYIVDVCSNSDFAELEGVGKLAKTMVETKKNHVYSLVYLLVKLTLLLPVATATVERVFFVDEIDKNPIA